NLVRNDPNGVAQIATFLEDNRPENVWAQSIAAMLINVGTPEAQDVIQAYYFNGKVDEILLRDVLITVSTLENPTTDFVSTVAAFASDKGFVEQETATLILGALLHSTAQENPEFTAKWVGQLEDSLLKSEDVDNTLLYLSALGNAGQDSTFYSVASFVDDADPVVRLTAIESLRKMPTAEVEMLLEQRFNEESHETVKMAIANVAMERGDENINTQSSRTEARLANSYNWSWGTAFGSSRASVGTNAYLSIQKEPFYANLVGGSYAKIFGRHYTLARAQLMTQKVSATTRRYYIDLKLVGNTVYHHDSIRTCAVNGSGVLYRGSVSLPGYTSPPIYIWGPLHVRVTARPFFSYALVLYWNLNWCNATSANGYVMLVPQISFGAVGSVYASIYIARAGLSLSISVWAGIYLRLYANLSAGSSANSLRLDIDLLTRVSMNISAWYQTRRLTWRGWRWNGRHSRIIWRYAFGMRHYHLNHHAI
ncbi:MAG TPA: hypothetical protein ENJ56_03735, partial [Anaerolineae bacterium]|nr:hypothetical protein [Anaerolineae bacterium]